MFSFLLSNIGSVSDWLGTTDRKLKRNSVEHCTFRKQGVPCLVPEVTRGLMGWKGGLESDCKESCLLEVFTS